jgi:type II secretory pathway component PulF
LQPYSYKALGTDGRRSEGTLVAADRREALERLLSQGWHVLELGEQQAKRGVPLGERFSLHRGIRLATLTRQLATLCGSGVPLVQSISVLIEQSETPRARDVLSDILESIKSGKSLSDALAEHRGLFPEMMISMVRMGEVSGTLDEVLDRLAELFERQEELRGEVRAALAYPTLVLLLGLASAAVLVIFIMPRLMVIFEDLGESLPLPTRILCGIAEVVHASWWYLALGIAAAVVGLRIAIRRPPVRLAWDRFKLRIPLAGRLIQQAAIARFARALGTLVRADVSIVEALDVAQAAVGNAAIAVALREMGRQVQTGHSLAALMRSSEMFPPLPIQMVAVGEESGHLDQMLLRLAEAYDRETTASTKMMTSLLAPALILCVAVIVAFIILSLVLPIFQISAGFG